MCSGTQSGHPPVPELQAENYSIVADSRFDSQDSRITFVRVAPIRSAPTRYEP
jgi:hypothetical protein